jgi:hypothetical protein
MGKYVQISINAKDEDICEVCGHSFGSHVAYTKPGEKKGEIVLAGWGCPEEPVQQEECFADTHSWWHFTPQQMDPYWIRCTEMGQHEEHHDENTGLRWKD